MKNADGDMSSGSFVSASQNPAILKNEILLNKDGSTYTEVRHIVLKGTNEEIGKAIGDIPEIL